ncbi:hypothetical protein FSP39_006765 [Pinctada imbricata]|uniref:Uncharacterized protein n=1 Tax=Pinctada imbricata TaxID=66713 RepID=A0AA88YMT9_PINIB|nr:hypothetical protein FSP39_006765 [Pinctada imbricata]
MPELTEAEQGHTSRQGSGHRSSMTINKELQANRTRIGSAKYYDVASALLGKGKADLEELFLNAARDGDFDQIEHFLLRRSDVIISIDVKDKRTGNTALIWASKRGHTKIVQLLLRHGADITLRNYESVTAVEVASPAIKTLLLDSVDRSTESSHRLLLQAAWQGNVKVLRKLLTDNRVKDINCQNADGLTALLLVCRDIQLFERLSTQLNRQYNPVEVVEELLKHRANIHASDGDDKSCLHYAVQSKATQASLVVQTILSAGPNLGKSKATQASLIVQTILSAGPNLGKSKATHASLVVQTILSAGPNLGKSKATQASLVVQTILSAGPNLGKSKATQAYLVVQTILSAGPNLGKSKATQASLVVQTILSAGPNLGKSKATQASLVVQTILSAGPNLGKSKATQASLVVQTILSAGPNLGKSKATQASLVVQTILSAGPNLGKSKATQASLVVQTILSAGPNLGKSKATQASLVVQTILSAGPNLGKSKATQASLVVQTILSAGPSLGMSKATKFSLVVQTILSAGPNLGKSKATQASLVVQTILSAGPNLGKSKAIQVTLVVQTILSAGPSLDMLKATKFSLVVQTILSAGPSLDAKDKRLFAPIHCASQTGNVECLEVLLEGGSNVNHRGFNGTTPLHITAYNDHERAACCLLKHGADITMVDDTGLTALDLARGRKMKATLKEAWTEATQSRQSTNLGPLKTPGREDTRLSTDDNKRRKGEVIFDALPTNPFSNMKNVTNRGGKPVTRHLSLKEKASRAEESMMKDIENGEFKPSPYMKDGVRRLGLVRGQRTSPTPLPKVSSRERLPAISPSPDRMAGDRNTDSPAFNRNTRFRRSLEEGKLIHKNGKPATYPVPGSRPNRVSPLTIRDNTRTSPLTVRDNNRVSPVTVRDTTRISPLTILDDMDVDQCMQINRFQPPSPTPVNSKQVKFHRRAGSDSITTNTNDILESCTSFIHRGRSTSLSHSEDYSDHMTHHVTRYPQREATQYYPLSREPAQKSLYNHGDRCITKTTSEVILDLDRMGLINKCPQTPVQGVQLYPTSSKILPPTPTFANQGENTHLESKTMEDKSRRNSSSKEPSPRSDDEDAINDKEVKMAFSGTLELLRSRSIYKDEFVLEESRPRDLSLRSSSSEESHRSKASEASTSSGEVFVKGADTVIDRQDRGGIGDRKGGGIGPKKAGGKTNNVAKIASANQKPQGMGAEAKKGSVGVNNNASRPSALVTAFVPKQNQLLNNNSALKNKTESSQSKVTAKSAGENRNKITVHSQIPNDTEDKQNVPKNEKLSVKSSAVVQSKSGVLRIGPNAAGNKNPMQVVSSKLLSNVKEEIKRNKELADNGTDNDKKEEEMEVDREDEQEKVLAAKNKLTKSESNMMGIKQENAKTVEVARPKTQASAQNGAVVQKNGSVGQNKVIVASANQNSRNSTANKNSIIPPNKNTPSANQSTRNSNLSANQNNKSSVPSYLQPTRSSMTRDSSPNTARRTPATTRNSATTNTRSVSGNSTNKNLQSNVSKSGVSQNPVSANSKQTTFTSISKGSENDQTKNTSSSSVTTNTNTTAVNVTSAAAKSVTSSASQSKTTTIVVSSKPNASMSAGKSTKPITSSANSTNRTNVSPATKQPSVNVTSTLTSNSKSTSSVGSASKGKVNPASTSASRVGSSSGVSSASSQSGIKKSTSDSNISQPLSANTSGVSSTDTIVSGKTEVQKDSATIQKSNSTTKSDTQSNVSKEGVVKVPNFPYKPASAGKPPLVEIVTANSPRIPKSKCVDSEVVIPVQTPLIVNPFEELYKEQAAALEKENEKKGNAKGVSATSYGFVVGKPQMERSKTNVSVKSQGKGGKKGRDGKPTSATAKLGGVRRKGAKSKEGKGSDEGVSRPKSGKKRARSGKRRKKVPADVLSKQAAQPDIALISGIGWHLATKCIDTSDVIAVKTRGSHSSLSSIDSEDDLDNPTPRPERMLTEEDLQLLTSQDFHFPLNLDLDTPRNPDILVDTPAPGPSSAKYLPVNELLLHDSHSAANTPRFRQVKQTERVEHLPKMDYDGYRPMNLDLSQATLPAYLNPESLERDKWKNSLPSDVALLNMGVGADEIEVISNPELDKATAELHRQILLGKLTPIPESPSIKSSLPLHKTVEALQKFDRNVQGETLDNLLGLKPGEIPVSSRTDESDNLRSSAKNMQGQKYNGKEGARQRSSSSDQIQGKGSKENGVPAKQRSWSTSDGPIDSKEAVRLSIENIRAAIEKSKKTNEKKSSTKIRKSASDSKLVRRSVDVPKLDLSQVDHFTDRTDKDPGLRTGQSTRRERKFSETKSDEKNDDFVDDNLDEAIEDIMSNTMNSTSTLRSNKSYSTGSRSNTLTDADRQLIMKMTSNNESPFHAKANVSASASETSRKRHHSDSYDEAYCSTFHKP